MPGSSASPPIRRRFIGDDVLLLVLDHPDAARARLAPLFDRIDALPPATITLRGRVLADRHRAARHPPARLAAA